MKRFLALYLLTIFLLLAAFPILAQSEKQVNSLSINTSQPNIIVDGTGHMIYLVKDSHETLQAYTSIGKVFRHDPISDVFTLKIKENAMMNLMIKKVSSNQSKSDTL